jgi:hypothetical protein
MLEKGGLLTYSGQYLSAVSEGGAELKGVTEWKLLSFANYTVGMYQCCVMQLGDRGDVV